jgi:hypothetical protein
MRPVSQPVDWRVNYPVPPDNFGYSLNIFSKGLTSIIDLTGLFLSERLSLAQKLK